MLDVQNVEYVLPGTSVEIGARSDRKTKWIFIDDKVSRFASVIPGLFPIFNNNWLFIENFDQTADSLMYC